MIPNDKNSIVQYAQELIKGELDIPYYNLKILFELNKIEIERINFVESDKKSLTVIECSNLNRKKDSVILTISEKSWLEYLPSIYKDNETLKNFLYGIQATMFKQTEIVDNIEDIFIPRKSEFLDWLASWYGVSFSSSVLNDTKRKLVYRLIELYKKRGTKEYLIEMVKILTDKNIEIIEREIPNYLKDEEDFIGEEYNLKRTFMVKILEDFSDDKETERLFVRKIRNILDREKPAFTEYYIDSDVEQEKKRRGIDVADSDEKHKPYLIEEEPEVDHYGYEKIEIVEQEQEEIQEKIIKEDKDIKEPPKTTYPDNDDDDDDFFDYD